MAEKLIRIGEKIISLRKVRENIRKILKLRSNGLSQQEVANELNLDRTFISRLESIGEVRKGKKIAVFGFPLQNKEEIAKIARAKGVDYVWLMNEKERWQLVKGKSALSFFNEIMELVSALQDYDIVIIISSPRWLKVAKALLTNEIIFIELGTSPITEDRILDIQVFEDILNTVLLK
ncbi:MAG: helix-turn-helix transcriptional regulator [Firmicutes bacterium]|nr:helix-turn-helix transcriptional regulator [Bacillota bacterium]